MKSFIFFLKRYLTLKISHFYSSILIFKLNFIHNAKIPYSCNIGKNFRYTSPNKFSFGENCIIREECNFIGKIHLGQDVIIAANTTIIAEFHNFNHSLTIPFGIKNVNKPVFIDDFVWIGSNVTILGEMTIGRGAIISAGSVVQENVPPMAIVKGNPAKIVFYRDITHFNRLLNEEKFFSKIVLKNEPFILKQLFYFRVLSKIYMKKSFVTSQDLIKKGIPNSLFYLKKFSEIKNLEIDHFKDGFVVYDKLILSLSDISKNDKENV